MGSKRIRNDWSDLAHIMIYIYIYIYMFVYVCVCIYIYFEVAVQLNLFIHQQSTCQASFFWLILFSFICDAPVFPNVLVFHVSHRNSVYIYIDSVRFNSAAKKKKTSYSLSYPTPALNSFCRKLEATWNCHIYLNNRKNVKLK